MQSGDANRFGQSFGMMCEVFDKKTTPLITKAYFQALRDLTIDQVEMAIGQSIAEGKWFPKPIELRERVMGPKVSHREEVEGHAMQQVNEIIGQIRAVGSYGVPDFSDAITADLMRRRFNFKALCGMSERDMKFWAKDFCEAYCSLKNSGSNGIMAIEACNSLKQLTAGIGG